MQNHEALVSQFFSGQEPLGCVWLHVALAREAAINAEHSRMPAQHPSFTTS